MTEYDNTNSGVMFPAGQMEVFRQGTVDIEGKDHEIVICKKVTPKGKTVYEVYQKMGAVWPVTDKRNDNSPDMSGEVDTSHGQYKMFGRKKVSKNGTPMTTISLAPAEERPVSDTRQDSNTPVVADTPDLDADDIPF